LEKHIKRNDKQLALDLPATNVAEAAGLQTEGLSSIMIKTEEKVVETISEDKIKSNGHLTYKKTQKISIANLGNAPVCPSCANMMLLAEGCMKCEFCGYSKCG
jgi:tRNA(Ile2) C34 agmatinyltransferase TiaS